MAYFRDMSPCTYFESEIYPIGYKNVLAVGWIDKLKNGKLCSFKKGRKPKGLIPKLKKILRAPWYRDYFQYCGQHTSAIDGAHIGSGDFFIPYKGKIYAAPFGIIRYIRFNKYVPPKKLVEAILAIDEEMSCDDYLEKIGKIDRKFYWLMKCSSRDIKEWDDFIDEPWYKEHMKHEEKLRRVTAARRTVEMIEYEYMKKKCDEMSMEELAQAIKDSMFFRDKFAIESSEKAPAPKKVTGKMLTRIDSKGKESYEEVDLTKLITSQNRDGKPWKQDGMSGRGYAEYVCNQGRIK